MSNIRSRQDLGIAIICFVACTSPALAGVNSWTPVGPDGGQVRAVTFHPTQAGVVLAAAGDSFYRSTDGGQTWTNVRGGVQNTWTRIVFDPSNVSRVMASAGDALWRSDDGGWTFNIALGPAFNVAYQTLAIAFDGSALYTTTTHGDVFRSTNFGSAWVERSPGLPDGDFVRDLVVDPQNADTVYALTYESDVYRSTDGGVTWALRNTLTNLPSFKIAVDPGDSTRLLLAAHGGVYSSQDSGATWTQDASGSYSWVGYHPSTTSRVGAAVAIGDQWPTLRRSSRTNPWIAGVTLKVRAEDASFDRLHDDLVNSRLVLASAAGPLFTQDSGVTFAARAQGIRASSAYALATDTVHGAVYAAFQSGPIGIVRRTASGWAETDNVELLANVPSVFLPLALAANGDTVFVSSGNSLLRSLDAGQSWSQPFGVGHSRAIAFAPSNPQVLYVATDNQGVFRTDNQGVTWMQRGTPSNEGSNAIAVDPLDPNIAYVGDRIALGASAVLYKTTNGGISWAPANTGLSVQTLDAIVVDPIDGHILYAGGVGNGEGLFKSTNAGGSWTRVGSPIGDAPGVSIAVDPIVGTNVVMVMNSVADGAARSVDAGATWEDLPFPRPPGGFHRLIRLVALDPRHPHVIIGSANDYGLMEFEVSPDLEVVISSAPAALPLGGTGTATVRVRNRGPLAASAVQLRLAPPTGAPITLVAPGQGLCAIVSNVLTCNLGAIRVNQSVDTALTLRGGNTPASGTLTASVEAHESDPEIANNSVSAAVATTRIANLGVALAPSAAEVDRGVAVTLTATATNTGPNASDATQVVVTLGSGLTYRTATATQGTCTHNAGTVTCAVGRIDATQQAVATIEATAAIVGTLTPAAAVTDNVLDPVAANDSATTTVTSRAVVDASVQVTDVPDPVVAGQALQYSATIGNAGPDDLPATTVTITFVGTSVSSASSNGGSCATTSTTATCTLTGVAAGASTAIQVQTTPAAAGTASATASLTFQGTDPTNANNSATQSTTVNAPPSGGGGGGGGTTSLLELAILAAMLGISPGMRRRIRRRTVVRIA